MRFPGMDSRGIGHYSGPTRGGPPDRHLRARIRSADGGRCRGRGLARAGHRRHAGRRGGADARLRHARDDARPGWLDRHGAAQRAVAGADAGARRLAGRDQGGRADAGGARGDPRRAGGGARDTCHERQHGSAARGGRPCADWRAGQRQPASDRGLLPLPDRRIARAVRARPILGAGTLFLSAGAAELQEGDRPNDLFERADDALYRAKELGKARTVLANGA